MRIGVLTYHYEPNFGAQLQTMSTIGFIKRMGHTPILLHWHPKDLDQLYGGGRIPNKQWKCHLDFAQKYFPLTKVCQDENELVQEIERNNLDLIITGSDALFKYKPIALRRHFSRRKFRYITDKIFFFEEVIGNPFYCDYYEMLKKKIPVVAFSVSSQNCNYEKMSEEELLSMRNHLNKFQSITVRDDWTQKMVEYVTGNKSIKITPDPVFSFNQNCYIHIPTKKEILAKYNLQDHYVLISFWTNRMSKNYIQSLASALKQKGKMPVAFPMPEGLKDFGLEQKVNIPISPIDWYSLIINSDGYIGERMHPIVVCLHNVIPFFAFDEYGILNSNILGLRKKYIQKSSKTYHIVNNAGLQGNLYAYKSGETMPSPDEVALLLVNFDGEKCSKFAYMQQQSYEKQMQSYLEL